MVKWLRSRSGMDAVANLTTDLRICAYYHGAMLPFGSTEPAYRAYVFNGTLMAKFNTVEEAKAAAVAEAKRQIIQAAIALGLTVTEQQS